MCASVCALGVYTYYIYRGVWFYANGSVHIFHQMNLYVYAMKTTIKSEIKKKTQKGTINPIGTTYLPEKNKTKQVLQRIIKLFI